jgi:5,10-methenyltetrahydrofolate synthetase
VPPASVDECGIPSVEGATVVPDVVVVPCLGYTASGYRLGYGGGYFDRWLAAHPHATTVGVAWSATELAEDEFAREPHDLPLLLVVTERGVLGG